MFTQTSLAALQLKQACALIVAIAYLATASWRVVALSCEEQTQYPNQALIPVQLTNL